MRKKISFHLLALPVVFFMVVLIVFTTNNEKENSRRYFKQLSLELTGIVKGTSYVNNSSGIIYLRVLKSNIENYDMRKSGKPYYCLIKDEDAELIEGGLSEVQINDSIVVSSLKDSIYVFRKNVIYTKRPLFLRPPSINLTKDEINKMHKIK